MSLADYGGKYFGVGKHPVTVKSLSFFKYNTGSSGVQFVIGDARREAKLSLCLVERALWKVANFAEACGMTVEQQRTFNEKSQASYRWFVGKRFVGVFDKEEGSDGKMYTQCVDFEALPVNIPPSVDRRPEPQKMQDDSPIDDIDPEPVFAPVTNESPVHDDIPFSFLFALISSSMLFAHAHLFS